MAHAVNARETEQQDVKFRSPRGDFLLSLPSESTQLKKGPRILPQGLVLREIWCRFWCRLSVGIRAMLCNLVQKGLRNRPF